MLQIILENDHRLRVKAERRVELQRRAIIWLRTDPDSGAAQLTAPVDHRGAHCAGDAAAAIVTRGSDLRDEQLSGLVGMVMDYRGALADDLAVGEPNDQMVAGCGEIRGQVIAPDRPVEHVRGDIVEHGGVSRADATDFEGRGGTRLAGAVL